MGGLPVTSRIVEHLSRFAPGQRVTRGQLCQALELEPQAVMDSMRRLALADTPLIKVVHRGRVWELLPTSTQAQARGPVFTVQESLGGALVLRDDAGALWLAKRIGRADT